MESATLPNGKPKSESWKWEISKQEIYCWKCFRKSQTWKMSKFQNQTPNLKTGNAKSLKVSASERLRKGKSRNSQTNLVQLSKMESPNLKAANGKSESRKYDI